MIALAPTPSVGGGALVLRQLRAVLGLELNKALCSRRAIPLYGLSLVPVALIALVGLVRAQSNGGEGWRTIAQARDGYAIFYTGLVLGTVVFFGSALLFTYLFRGEVLNRSLHYYLLSPVRREVLVAGKYLAGLITSFGLFGAVTIVTYILLYIPFGSVQLSSDVTSGVFTSQLGAYVGVTALACVGYGAVFLLMGVLFRNPIIPIGMFLGWEIAHFLLPPALKAMSVVHYLKGLIPVPMYDGPLAIIVPPPAPWVSVLSLCTLALVAVAVAVVSIRRAEIYYTED